MLRRILLSAATFASLLCIAQVAIAASAAPVSAQQTAIAYVRTNTIMADAASGTFLPAASVTREEFAVSVVERLYPFDNQDTCFQNISSTGSGDFTLLFSDVHKDSLHGKQLCIAIHAGLIDGNRDASFHPNQPITVGEASKIMAKAMGLVYPSLLPAHGPWYEASMRALSMREAIGQNANPNKILTRGDMAVMYYALRTQQRYPLRREIGNASDVIGVSVLPTRSEASARTDASASADVYRTRHAAYISRRALLAKIRAKGYPVSLR
jgi:hypothetical protein